MAEENEFFRPIREIEQRRVVSCSADDALVDIVKDVLGTSGGVRMTGGGFGGCVVALLRPEKVAEVIAAVEAEYPTVSGLKADCYVCRSTDGACRN